MPNPDLVTLERDGHVATLTLNDPDRRNVMTRDMGEVFSERIAALGDDRDVRAVIVTGAGKAFAAGGDFSMLEKLAARGAAGGEANRIAQEMRSFYGLYLSVRDLDVPSIAAINGAAIGAGLCFALGCDIRIASSSARLALNFASLGLHPGMGGTWTLPRLVGPAVAAELLYSGRVIDPDEAVRMGLLNRAVAPEDVLPQARELAKQIAAAAPIAIRGIKRAMAASPGSSIEHQLEIEASEQALCFETRDVQAGLAAARDRRATTVEDFGDC
jgi:enoyl-CoA hydratase/carnithine racemase